MQGYPLVICYHYEKERLTPLFPNPCAVRSEGEALGAFPAAVILVTKHININSDWFRECAMHRLRPGGKVVRIGDA